MLIPSEIELSVSSLFSAYASLTALMMMLRSVKDLVPSPLQSYLQTLLNYLFTPLSPRFLTIVIDDRAGISTNEVYEAAEIYLRTKLTPATERFKVNKTPRQKKINVGVEKDIEVIDIFQNVELKWKLVLLEPQNNYSGEKKFFELSFNKKFKQTVLDDYFPFLLAKSKEIKDNDKVVKLYTRDFSSSEDDEYGGDWGSINLEHPSTFDTVAMDPDMKKVIIDDLERFVRRKDYYKKVGKAWKRGYLLYGPPGTGKSSLVAAMANFLHFDIYDLELTSIYCNSDLRRVLLSTKNRSIILVEDIDCSAQMKDRAWAEQDESNSKLTLSGLLNFIDGLWSSCGDERIIVFTTNHKDRLDPALLRPGRMDMHIHMSYCTFSGFRILASNYLGVKHDQSRRQFGEIEELMGNVNVTPAEVAEELMKSEDVDIALDGVLNFLKHKGMESASNAVKDDDEKHATVENNVKSSSIITEAKNAEAQLQEPKLGKANGIEKMALKFFRKVAKGKRKNKTFGR